MNRLYYKIIGAFFVLFLLLTEVSTAQVIVTVAGTPGTAGYGGDGSAATSALISQPYSVAADASGNLYIADFGNARIRKVSASGTISTFAGTGTSGYSGDGAAATSAKLNNPVGVAVDGSGNVYIADFGNSVIRKVNTSGVISTVAGTGTAGFSGDGGAATSAKLNSPVHVTIDASGNMYIADYQNHRIRKVNTSGTISTVAGNGTNGYGSDGVSATSTSLNFPTSVMVDATGNIYISDNSNNRIRKVDTSGIISTIVGTGTSGFSGDGGAATAAKINGPWGVTFDIAGNMYFADGNNNRIRRVSPSGIITTYAGSGSVGHTGDNGLAIFAAINRPANPIIDAQGVMYFAENNGASIRKIYGGQALGFDGTNDYVDFGNILNAGSSYTKEALVYANSLSSNSIFGAYDHPLWIASGHLAAANNFSGNGFVPTVSDTATFPTGEWVHVAVTYDSATSTMKLYKNGTLVASTTSAPSYAASSMQMGVWNLSKFWNGSIDEVRLWNVVRTQSQIASNISCDLAQQTGLIAYYRMNQGTPGSTNTDISGVVDYSGNNNCGALHNFALTGSVSNFVAGKANSCNIINVPMINVQGNSNNIINGATTTSTSNATNFGTASSPVSKTYTIQNKGGAALSVSSVSISGAAASDFVVTVSPASPVSAGGSTTFTITFTPSTAGVRNATVTITSTACDMASYTFAINGTGTCSAPIAYAITGGGTKCPGSTGVLVGLSNSQASVNYQLRYGASNLGSPVAGTGSAISFGIKALLGTYTVVATTASGGCVTTMSGSATITNDIAGPVVITKTATAYLDALGVATIGLSDVDSATTDNCLLVSRVLNRTTFTCADKGPNTVILTALDNSGNLTNGTAIVNVVDTIKPVVTTQNATLYLDDNGLANVATTDIELLSTDICGVASRAVDISTLNCSNLGNNTITLLVSDYSGNVGTGTATVTLYDTTTPVIRTHNINVYLDSTGNVNITGLDVDNGSTDNCSIASRTLSKSHFTCADEGTNTVTLTITDNSGNSVSQTAIVTVVDTTKPKVITKNTTVYLNSFFSSTISVSDIDNGSTDNCSIASRSLSKTSFSCADLGSNTVTLTVTDNSGNVQTGTALVTVVDTTKPVVNTRNITVYLSATGSISITPAAVDNSSTDNCSIANRTLNLSSFNCSNIGSNTVTLTVTDASGNSQSATATVTVADTIRPTVHTQNITAYLNAAGTAGITAAAVDNSSTDNCTIATRTLSTSSFTCANVGTNTVTLTVTDNAGNSNAGTAVVTVVDTTRPIAVTRNITAYLSAAGSVTITPSQVDNGSSDNCSIATRSLDVSSFTAANMGANTVTLTVTDNSSNSNSATAVVTVVDSTKPVVHTRNITAYLNASNIASITAADVDNGSTDNGSIVSRTIDVSSFNCSNVGVNTVTLTVTDNSGNIATGTAIVTVADTIKPIARTKNKTIYLSATGTASIATSDIDSSSTDNCTVSSLSLSKTNFNCSNLGTNTVTLTVTDNSGTIGTGNAIVTVVDAIAPVITCPGAITAPSGSTTPTTTGTATATDNCTASPAITYTDVTTSSSITRTWKATDASGNYSTCTQTITISATTPISISGSVTNVSCRGGSNGAITLTVTGGSGTLSYSWSSGAHTKNISGLSAGTYTVTVTDASGSTKTGSFTVAQPSTALTASITVSPVYRVSPGGAAYTIYKGYGLTYDTLIASVSGGTSGYTYSWSPSSTVSAPSAYRTRVTPTATTTYSVTITDANGCSIVKTQTISVIDVRCSDDGDDEVYDDDDDDDHGHGCGNDDDDDHGHGHRKSHHPKKVLVCHVKNGRDETKCIDSTKVAGKLAKGYYLGSCDNSSARIVTNSIEEEEFHITVFPNPNNGAFSVMVPATTGTVELQVVDMTGKVIATKSIQDGTIAHQVDFNLSDVVRGMYFIKVVANEQAYLQKVIIQ